VSGSGQVGNKILGRQLHARQWGIITPCVGQDTHALQHASNLLLAHILVQARIEVAPPLVKHALADELEPRRELERRVLEHALQLLLAHIARIPCFVGVHRQIDVRLDEQNVVNCTALAVILPFIRRHMTDSHARPTFHRWGTCSVFS